MFGVLSKNSANTKHARRAYLFVLLSLVIFLFLVCLSPPGFATRRVTEVNIEITNVQADESMRNVVVGELKKQLSRDTLNESLDSISETVYLKSPVLARSDIGEVREKLLGGALSIESHKTETAQNNLMFTISLRGNGTEDERIFVSLLANAIREAVSPNENNEQIVARLKTIGKKLRDSAPLYFESRKSIESTFQKYAEKHRQLLVLNRTNRQSEADNRVNWEMKNLMDQRELAYEEFRKNIGLEFPDKENIQASLMRRIEYLDQQITRLRKKENSSGRFAENDSEVERASFIDSGKVPVIENDERLGELKSELAWVANKLDLANSSYRECLAETEQLDDLLSGRRSGVTVTDPVQNEVDGSSTFNLWIFLVVSSFLSGMLVMRIDSNAFGTFLGDPSVTERLLQMPVIGKVNLPGGKSRNKFSINQVSRWVNVTIQGCEVILVVVFVVLFVVLLAKSDFSIQWFNDPIRLIKTSFN